ncbi:MAG: B12-binding domain-containing radical SAM protein [Deltaproteobacteria bacterium]|nr:B12-binding domain-containing radical SAM protein [Deltaproteobacteria bacterium]MBW1952876.1 B12-binding domain-containing radical SAM protein [Deltaproteobacteria bacterium]MBW1985874.1 B12-binding domain-containing radical SAM protein [Deltaproteobacteria bacterium]MBW2133634.1 B12-binding domain-containing radical SAM protein [Deltaproteobacteria bacterium]
MKVLLIQPSRFRNHGRLDRRKKRWLLGMTLPYLAGLIPPDIKVQIKDDLLEEITFKEDCDLVAISFMSHQAPRAYQLATGFRQRGKKVVMGGFHVTLAPEESQQYADALVLGEAEETWPQLLRDFQAGRMQPRYQAEQLSDLQNLPVPRYELLDLKRYKLLNIPAQTTRGCPYACNYCEVTQVYGGKFRHRPVDQVLHEIKEIQRLTGSKFIYFVDDNFVANRGHAMEIMEKIIPLGLTYGCLATINIGNDLELLALMRRSGCLHVNIGMETISPESIQAINKKQNKIKDYERQFKALQQHGIGYSVNVMFGLDGDHPSIFDSTVDFLIRVQAPVSFMFILAPRVGTKIREQLQQQGRIMDNDWTHYCGFKVVYHPKYMTAQQLQEEYWRANRRFYSFGSILKRLVWPPRLYNLHMLPFNLIFAWCVRHRVQPLDYF